MRGTHRDNTARMLYLTAGSGGAGGAGGGGAGGGRGGGKRLPHIQRAHDHPQRSKPDMSEMSLYLRRLRMQAGLQQKEAAALATQAGQPVSVDFIHQMETQKRLERKTKLDYLRLRALLHLYAEHGAPEASWQALDRAAGGYTPLDVRQATGVITTGDALANVVNQLEPEQQAHLVNYVRMLAREAQIEAHLATDVLAALPERYAPARHLAETTLSAADHQEQHDELQSSVEDTLQRTPQPTNSADDRAQGDGNDE